MSFNKVTSFASEKGVCSEGFRTAQFPNAIAAAIFMVANAKGAFQGAIKPTTPAGSLFTNVR